jgi:hypothetical protein
MRNTTEQRLREIEDTLLEATRHIQATGRVLRNRGNRDDYLKATARCLCNVDHALTRATQAACQRNIQRVLAKQGNDPLAQLLLRKCGGRTEWPSPEEGTKH